MELKVSNFVNAKLNTATAAIILDGIESFNHPTFSVFAIFQIILDGIERLLYRSSAHLLP